MSTTTPTAQVNKVFLLLFVHKKKPSPFTGLIKFHAAIPAQKFTDQKLAFARHLCDRARVG
jgi:hypothetical protein